MKIKEIEDIAANLLYENRRDADAARKRFFQQYPDDMDIFERVRHEMKPALRSYP